MTRQDLVVLSPFIWLAFVGFLLPHWGPGVEP
jgi:hypothetical protein